MSYFATTLTKVLVQRKQIDDLTPGPGLPLFVFVSERNSCETDVNVSQNDHCFFYISHCVCVWGKVIILNFISCGLMLEVQDNLGVV